MRELNRRWVPSNRISEARDRGRIGNDPIKYSLGDININPNSGAFVPMVPPMVEPMTPALVPPLVRKHGESVNHQRRAYGNTSLWANTIVAAQSNSLGHTDILGDAEIDLTEYFSEYERVGWEWDRKANCLKAYLTSNGNTYIVKIPYAKLASIFNKVKGGAPFKARGVESLLRESVGHAAIVGRPTHDEHGHLLVYNKRGKIKQRISYDASGKKIKYNKHGKKKVPFFKKVGIALKKVVKAVGKVVLKIAKSKVFAGIMSAIAVIPPLTAIGGAGLAAYAAANAIKPAINIADGVGKAIKKGRKAVSGPPLLTSGNEVSNAKDMTDRFKSALEQMSPAPKQLVISALQSTEVAPLSKSRRGTRRKRGVYRLSKGMLTHA